MKITLWLTDDGCFRPVEIMQMALERLDRREKVTLVTSLNPRDIHVDGHSLGSAKWVRTPQFWGSIPKSSPALAVFSDLDFADPDAQELTSYQEAPKAVPVPRFRLERILNALRETGTEEVFLVQRYDMPSPAWRSVFEEWNVIVRMTESDRSRWRNWNMECREHGQEQALEAGIRGENSRALMELVAEFNALKYGPGDPQGDREKSWPTRPIRHLTRRLSDHPRVERDALLLQLQRDIVSLYKQVSAITRVPCPVAQPDRLGRMP